MSLRRCVCGAFLKEFSAIKPLLTSSSPSTTSTTSSRASFRRFLTCVSGKSADCGRFEWIDNDFRISSNSVPSFSALSAHKQATSPHVTSQSRHMSSTSEGVETRNAVEREEEDENTLLSLSLTGNKRKIETVSVANTNSNDSATDTPIASLFQESNLRKEKKRVSPKKIKTENTDNTDYDSSDNISITVKNTNIDNNDSVIKIEKRASPKISRVKKNVIIDLSSDNDNHNSSNNDNNDNNSSNRDKDTIDLSQTQPLIMPPSFNNNLLPETVNSSSSSSSSYIININNSGSSSTNSDKSVDAHISNTEDQNQHVNNRCQYEYEADAELVKLRQTLFVFTDGSCPNNVNVHSNNVNKNTNNNNNNHNKNHNDKSLLNINPAGWSYIIVRPSHSLLTSLHENKRPQKTLKPQTSQFAQLFTNSGLMAEFVTQFLCDRHSAEPVARGYGPVFLPGHYLGSQLTVNPSNANNANNANNVWLGATVGSNNTGELSAMLEALLALWHMTTTTSSSSSSSSGSAKEAKEDINNINNMSSTNSRNNFANSSSNNNNDHMSRNKLGDYLSVRHAHPTTTVPHYYSQMNNPARSLNTVHTLNQDNALRVVLCYDSEYAAKSLSGEYNGSKNKELIVLGRQLLASLQRPSVTPSNSHHTNNNSYNINRSIGNSLNNIFSNNAYNINTLMNANNNNTSSSSSANNHHAPMKVSMVHVKAHRGHFWNEAADQLANIGARGHLLLQGRFIANNNSLLSSSRNNVGSSGGLGQFRLIHPDSGSDESSVYFTETL